MNFKAAVLFKKNKVILENLQVPKLKESQVLVKILYTSICKTQIGEILGQRGKDKFLPHCLGHEATGIIIDKNKKVKKKNLLTGIGLVVFIILLFIFTFYNVGVFERVI